MNLKDIIYIINGYTFKCDDVTCGYALKLSTAQDLKSSNFNKVKTIIFDEFIIEEGQKKYYLKNEVFTFLNLLETIGRMRDIRVFMLANSVTITNPYFLFFDIKLPYNSDIATFKNGLILVQYMKNEEYRQEKKKSKFRQVSRTVHLSKNTRLIMNLSLTTIILLRKNKVRLNFHLHLFISGFTFGVWVDFKLR